MKKLACGILLFLYTLICYANSCQPKLILQIVIDQLRGDLIYRHHKQFGPSGFNYLLSHGIDYHNAHHPHANTTTCVGHSTIATGSFPSLHGVIDNDWYDRKTKQIKYCMEDLQVKILPTVHTRTEIPGRSPHNLKASTSSDEIILAKKGRAFAVSLKDRAAITLAGHAGKAFWFDKTNGGFITTNYYYSDYPSWVVNWNKNYQPKEFDWTLSHPKSFYQNADTPPFRHNYGNFGQTFPHHVINPPSEAYFKALSRTPKADELTANFAQQLLIHEKLGQTADQTDYLAVSFSAVDAIGHQFGPNSLEAEDNLITLDNTLSDFFKIIDKEVGLNNTLIILTADHGVSDGPAYLKAHKISEIKPINLRATEQSIKGLLKKRYNLPPQTLMSITPPFIYFDHQIIKDKQLNVAEISQYIAEEISHFPGVFRAYPLPLQDVEKDWLSSKVGRMSYTYRAGDVYLVQPPYQSNGAKSEDRVNHGSPWQYDTYVPLLFAHPSLKPKFIFRQVSTTDIAPTLSSLLLIKQPSASVGQPLFEVLDILHKAGEND
ncbi:alkaline phosphatase [Legionella norrlandica]|uniref:Alkaline phosphatase n=1 Tax=Legionella norrlandica TaxID=1498499 RepID=A0A0A2SVT7_9GAMM|nr:alkaline phosphatase family protein [Legionella norrlandica]KGP63544.1 alkaline phosphatase [Legionella norrlandica]